MYSPKDDETQGRMEHALARACDHFGTTATGPVSWGWLGRTIGSRTTDDRWLRVHCGEIAKASAAMTEGIVVAEERISSLVSRPHLHGLHRWESDPYVFEGELIDYIAQPVISPETPDLAEDPHLPDAWWSDLRNSLDALADAEPPRTTIRQEWADRVFPNSSASPRRPSPNASPATPISSGPTSPDTPSSCWTGNAGEPSPSATTPPCCTSTASASRPSPSGSARSLRTSWRRMPGASPSRSPSPRCSRP